MSDRYRGGPKAPRGGGPWSLSCSLHAVARRPQSGALNELVGRLEPQLLLDVDTVRLDRLGREHHRVGHLGGGETVAEVASNRLRGNSPKKCKKIG